MRILCLGFTNPVGTGGNVGCVFGLRWYRLAVGRCLDQDLEGWGGVMSV